MINSMIMGFVFASLFSTFRFNLSGNTFNQLKKIN